MDVEIADDLRAQGIRCNRLLDPPRGFDGVVGSDEEAAVLLPVVIGELVSALERLVGPDKVARQVDEWLDQRAARLTG